MLSSESYSHLEAFIFDLDGVIWKGNAPIEGAVESVARLREAGKRVFYCTNNSRRSPGEFADTLRSLGIECEDEEVMTSSIATSLYLQSLFTGPYTAYVVGEEGLVQTIRRTGAIVMTSPIMPERSDMHDNHGAVDCVIVGMDSTFTYHKLRVAQRLVMSGARFIATNRDATFPTPYGLVPGAGSVVAAVETATGVTPVTLGKPQPFMAQLLMQKFGLKPETTCLVGDRLDTDIVAAKRAHITALLITTGVHSREVAERAKGLQKPHAIFDDMPALCEAVFAPGGAVTGGASTGEEALSTTQGSTVSTGVLAAAGTAAAGTTVIAADAAQHEPEEVLHTPVAEAAAAEPELAPFDFAFPEGTAAPAPAGDGVTENTAETLPLDSPAAPGEPASGESAASGFSFDDEKPAMDAGSAAAPTGATEPAANGTAAEEAAVPFDFSLSFADDASAPVAPTEEPAADTGPVFEEDVIGTEEGQAAGEESAGEEATGEETEPAESEEKWWESLDNI